jgi:hypothetical protein
MASEFNNSPLKAIRKKCIDCSAGHTSHVRHCPVKTCDLWPFRFGKRPKTLLKKQGTLEG